jgi:hypothetical protein
MAHPVAQVRLGIHPCFTFLFHVHGLDLAPVEDFDGHPMSCQDVLSYLDLQQPAIGVDGSNIKTTSCSKSSLALWISTRSKALLMNWA